MSGVAANPGVTPVTPNGIDVGKLALWTAAGATVPAGIAALTVGAGAETSRYVDGATQTVTKLPLKSMGRAALKAGAVGALVAAEFNLLRDISLPDSRIGSLVGGGTAGALAGGAGAVGVTAIITPSALKDPRGLAAIGLGAAALGYAIGSATGFGSPDRDVLPF